MKFDIIATQEYSRADFSAILAFGSPEHARISAKAINDSQWANTQRVTLGQSGAFQVGTHVMFNTYGVYAYGKIIDMLKKLAVPSTESDLYSSMWNSLVDPDAPYSEARDFVILFFTKVLPGATAEALEGGKDHMFAITYRNKKFIAEMYWSTPEGPRILFFTEENNTSDPDFAFYEGSEDIEDIRKIFDDFIDKQKPAGESKVTPESAMFAAMKDIDFAKALPKDTERKLKGIANLFLQSWLKEATLIGVEASDDIAAVNWVEVWFQYKGKKFHVDFCMEDGNNTLCLYATNKYQENIDCAYVTVDTLQEKIDSVDDAGYFPGQVIPACPREDVDELDREIPRKSLEERLDKVERLIASLQDEVKEIKKKI